MPQLLREIKKARWFAQTDNGPRPASALRDMQVDDKGRLSVWMLPDGRDRDDALRRTVIALTLNSGHCEKFEYALVDIEVLDELGIGAPVSSPGRTIDPRVNERHLDIEDLSVEKLAMLSVRFAPQPTVREREIGAMIADAVKSGDLDQTALPVDVDAKLVKWGYLSAEVDDGAS